MKAWIGTIFVVVLLTLALVSGPVRSAGDVDRPAGNPCRVPVICPLAENLARQIETVGLEP